MDDDIQYLGSRTRAHPLGAVTGFTLHIDKAAEHAEDPMYTFRKAKSNTVVVGRRPHGTPNTDPTKAMFRCPVVSRSHAKFTFSDSGLLYVTDTNSHHGTHIRKPRNLVSSMLKPETPTRLDDGDYITFGKSVAKSESTPVGPITARVELLYGPSNYVIPSPTSSSPMTVTPRNPGLINRSSSGRFGIPDDIDSSDSSSGGSGSDNRHPSPVLIDDSDNDSDVMEIPAPNQSPSKSSQSSSQSQSQSSQPLSIPPSIPSLSDHRPSSSLRLPAISIPPSLPRPRAIPAIVSSWSAASSSGSGSIPAGPGSIVERAAEALKRLSSAANAEENSSNGNNSSSSSHVQEGTSGGSDGSDSAGPLLSPLTTNETSRPAPRLLSLNVPPSFPFTFSSPHRLPVPVPTSATDANAAASPATSTQAPSDRVEPPLSPPRNLDEDEDDELVSPATPPSVLDLFGKAPATTSSQLASDSQNQSQSSRRSPSPFPRSTSASVAAVVRPPTLGDWLLESPLLPTPPPPPPPQAESVASSDDDDASSGSSGSGGDSGEDEDVDVDHVPEPEQEEDIEGGQEEDDIFLDYDRMTPGQGEMDDDDYEDRYPRTRTPRSPKDGIARSPFSFSPDPLPLPMMAKNGSVSASSSSSSSPSGSSVSGSGSGSGSGNRARRVVAESRRERLLVRSSQSGSSREDPRSLRAMRLGLLAGLRGAAMGVGVGTTTTSGMRFGSAFMGLGTGLGGSGSGLGLGSGSMSTSRRSTPAKSKSPGVVEPKRIVTGSESESATMTRKPWDTVWENLKARLERREKSKENEEGREDDKGEEKKEGSSNVKGKEKGKGTEKSMSPMDLGTPEYEPYYRAGSPLLDVDADAGNSDVEEGQVQEEEDTSLDIQAPVPVTPTSMPVLPALSALAPWLPAKETTADNNVNANANVNVSITDVQPEPASVSVSAFSAPSLPLSLHAPPPVPVPPQGLHSCLRDPSLPPWFSGGSGSSSSVTAAPINDGVAPGVNESTTFAGNDDPVVIGGWPSSPLAPLPPPPPPLLPLPSNHATNNSNNNSNSTSSNVIDTEPYRYPDYHNNEPLPGLNCLTMNAGTSSSITHTHTHYPPMFPHLYPAPRPLPPVGPWMPATFAPPPVMPASDPWSSDPWGVGLQKRSVAMQDPWGAEDVEDEDEESGHAGNVGDDVVESGANLEPQVVHQCAVDPYDEDEEEQEREEESVNDKTDKTLCVKSYASSYSFRAHLAATQAARNSRSELGVPPRLRRGEMDDEDEERDMSEEDEDEEDDERDADGSDEEDWNDKEDKEDWVDREDVVVGEKSSEDKGKQVDRDVDMDEGDKENRIVPSEKSALGPDGQEQLKKLSVVVNAMQVEIQSLEEYRRKYKARFNVNVHTMTEKIRKLDEISVEFSRLKDTVDARNSSYSELSTSLNDLTTSLDDVKESVDIARAEIDTAQREASEASDLTTTLQTTVNDLEERVRKQNEQQPSDEENERTMRTMMDQMRALYGTTTEKMQAELTALKLARQAAETELRAVAEVRKELERLSAQMSSAPADAHGSAGATESAPIPAASSPSLKRKRNDNDDENDTTGNGEDAQVGSSCKDAIAIPNKWFSRESFDEWMRQQSGSTLKGIDAGELLTSDVVTSDTMVVDDANSDDNHTVEASNDSSEGGSTSSVDASNATTIPANTVISTSPMTTTTKTSDGIDVPSPKRARASIHGAPTREMAGAPRRSRARRVASVVAQTTATVVIGAVAAWTVLAFT